MNEDTLFDHERLEAYRVAREANREIARLLRKLPPGNGEAVDQLKRASMSVPLNMAEGSGDATAREKVRFYTISGRSARECAAILDHLVDLQLLPQPDVRAAQMLLARVVAMLFKLARSCQPATPR